MLDGIVIFWKKHHTKIVIFLFILAAILLLGQRSKNKEILNREYHTANYRDVTEEVVIGGRVQTQQQADLSFSRSGRVSNVLVAEGQRVAKGDKLAQISMGQLFADLRNAQAEKEIAEADADVIDQDVDAARLELENIRNEQEILVNNAYRALLTNDLQAYNDDSGDSVPQPELSGVYEGEEGEYVMNIYSSKAKSGLSYQLSGLESGTTSVYTGTPGALGTKGLYIQFDSASNYSRQTWRIPIPNTRSATYTTYLNAYTGAQAAAQRAIDAAKDRLERVEAQEANDDRVARAEAKINQASARVSSVYAQIADGIIRAPFDGVVGSVELEEGEYVSVGQVGISLLGEEKYEIVLNVPEIDIAKVVIGDTVDLVLDAYPDQKWQGVVGSINVAETFVDGVPVYEATVSFLEPDDRIRPGMNGRARIQTNTKKDVIAIPAVAIEKIDRDTYQVRVVANGDELEERMVGIGIRGSDSFVEINSGLDRGDRVLIPQE